jgi:hypothetical protein
MAGSAVWVTQEAVYAKLTNDATLQSLLGGSVGAASRVFDAVPPNQEYPFVVIGSMSEVPSDTIGRSVKRLTAILLTFSRYQGAKEIAQVMDRVAALLDGVALTITGYEHIRTVHTRSLATRDDGVTRRGEQDFDIYAKQV